jgi:hypothetical protein
VNRTVQAALIAGVIAGTVDVGAASLINRVAPGIVLRAIASGLLGRGAFHQAAWVLPVGLVLQWAMSILIAAIYIAVAVRMPVLLRRWIMAGIACGIVVYVVMTYVVVPLSAAGMKNHFALLSLVENLAAMVVFGLILSFTARRLVGGAAI